MSFDNEVAEIDHPAPNGADSGVENDSNSSATGDSEAEVQPTASAATQESTTGQTTWNGAMFQSTASSSTQDKPIQFIVNHNRDTHSMSINIDMDTGDTDDGDLDNDVTDTSSRKSESSVSPGNVHPLAIDQHSPADVLSSQNNSTNTYHLLSANLPSDIENITTEMYMEDMTTSL